MACTIASDETERDMPWSIRVSPASRAARATKSTADLVLRPKPCSKGNDYRQLQDGEQVCGLTGKADQQKHSQDAEQAVDRAPNSPQQDALCRFGRRRDRRRAACLVVDEYFAGQVGVSHWPRASRAGRLPSIRLFRTGRAHDHVRSAVRSPSR